MDADEEYWKSRLIDIYMQARNISPDEDYEILRHPHYHYYKKFFLTSAVLQVLVCTSNNLSLIHLRLKLALFSDANLFTQSYV